MQNVIEESLVKLRESVEGLDAAKTERIGSPSLGDVVRQGDIYLVAIKSLPSGKKTENRQLAPGNTQGSRHCLEGKVEIIEKGSLDKVPEQLCGPAFKCVGDVTVSHPEHGHKVLPKGTVWQVTYQRAFSEEIRRVQD